MPRQGGQGKGKPKLAERHFGVSLIRSKKSVVDKKESTAMMSILENTSLDDYILEAEMNGKDAEVIKSNNDIELIQPVVLKIVQSMTMANYSQHQLSIPRKPHWTREMTKEQLDRLETDSFLQWRRELAAAEASLTDMKLTPFEKNINVWRQLWRVIERSDILIQVVDARNPLFYFSADLGKYVADLPVPKPLILLVNKADFLSKYQRVEWSRKFRALNIPFIYYSAKLETDRANAMDEATESKLNDINPLESIREMDLPDGIDVTMICNQICASLKKKSDQDETAEDIEDIIERNSKILSKEKLIELLEQVSHTLTLETNPKNQDRLCIGMTGYPNVGKSSVINTFLNASKSTHGPRVSVSSTPGRTKHLQTFVLSDSVMLCDCPGLVFPSFMKNVGEMLCAGVLPIHNMRDCIEPATAIATRIPQHILEAVYGIQIVRELDIFDSPTRPPTSLEVLAAYCAVKGYITNGTGRWDDFRATKDLLRDFNDGVLLFVAPPEIEGVDIEKWMSDTESTILQSKRIYDRLQKMRLKSSHEAEFDEIKAIDEDEEDDMDEEQSTSTNILANKAPTREHKRLKKWGKKGRLLRDKDPYGEGKGPEAYVAFFKNRTTTSMKIN